jgi:DNA replication protein DnaC
VTTQLGDTFTKVLFDKPFVWARYRCKCGDEFDGPKSSDEPLCKRCRGEQQRLDLLEQERQRKAKLTRDAVPPRFSWAHLDAPELAKRVKGWATIIDKARAALDAQSIVLLGDAGAGKTSLGCALLRAIADRRRKVGMFVTTFELAEARRQTRLGVGEAEAIRGAQRASILLIDELAAERSLADTAVDEVIRVRHDEERPTIFTSGFSRDEIGKRYGAGVERRVFEGAVVLRLGGVR